MSFLHDLAATAVIPNMNPDIAVLVVSLLDGEEPEVRFLSVIAWNIEGASAVATPIAAEDYGAPGSAWAVCDRRANRAWQTGVCSWRSIDDAVACLRVDAIASLRAFQQREVA